MTDINKGVHDDKIAINVKNAAIATQKATRAKQIIDAENRRLRDADKGGEFAFAGAYTPSSDKFETGTWVTSSEQKRMYNSVTNKIPTIDGADGYFYSLTEDKKSYLKWDSEEDYNTMLEHKKSKKEGLSGVTSDKVSFDDVLRFNAAGTGAPITSR